VNFELPKQTEIIGSKEEGKYISGIYRKMFGVVVYKSWGEMFQIEALLNAVKFSNIIELGTGYGSTAILMGVHSHMTGAKVFTYDDKPTVTAEVQKLYDAIGVEFEVIDIFENEKKIADLITRPGRTLLYCDNGNKNKELQMWSYYLKPGDVALVHDYPEETFQTILDEVSKLYNMSPFCQDWFESHCCSHRALIKEEFVPCSKL